MSTWLLFVMIHTGNYSLTVVPGFKNKENCVVAGETLLKTKQGLFAHVSYGCVEQKK